MTQPQDSPKEPKAKKGKKGKRKTKNPQADLIAAMEEIHRQAQEAADKIKAAIEELRKEHK
jgi:hypothetical protein